MAFTEIQDQFINDLIKTKLDEQENTLKKLINQLTKENKDLKKKLDNMEKTVNTMENDIFELSKDLEVTKRASFINDQYQRRNNIEFSGIPETVTDFQLENVCIRLIITS